MTPNTDTPKNYSVMPYAILDRRGNVLASVTTVTAFDEPLANSGMCLREIFQNTPHAADIVGVPSAGETITF